MEINLNIMKQYLTIILILSLFCNVASFALYADSTDSEAVVDNKDCESTNELMPLMTNSCSEDPLNQFFGAGYKVTGTDGTWIYIEGTNGYTGAYNTTTGYGYLNNDDGTKTGFKLNI